MGATLEEDNQNGLVHFLEHMAFNGTEHFPAKIYHLVLGLYWCRQA
ncbi:MAG: insulinase family protein [bacterium]